MLLSNKKIFVITAWLMVIIAAAFMQFGGVKIYDIRPDFMLVVLIVLAGFTDNPFFYFLLVLGGAMLIRVTPLFFDSTATAVGFFSLVSFVVLRRIVWPGLLGVSTLIAGSTIAVYLVIHPYFLLTHPIVVLAELVFNCFLGVLCYEIVRYSCGERV